MWNLTRYLWPSLKFPRGISVSTKELLQSSQAWWQGCAEHHQLCQGRHTCSRSCQTAAPRHLSSSHNSLTQGWQNPTGSTNTALHSFYRRRRVQQMCQHTPPDDIEHFTVHSGTSLWNTASHGRWHCPPHPRTTAPGLECSLSRMVFCMNGWNTHLLPEQRLTTLTAKTVPLFLDALHIYWFGQKRETEKHTSIHTHRVGTFLSSWSTLNAEGKFQTLPKWLLIYEYSKSLEKKILKQVLEQSLDWNLDLFVISADVHPLST